MNNKRDDIIFRNLVLLYYSERNDLGLNPAWDHVGLCPPVLTPNYTRSRYETMELWGEDRWEAAADRYELGTFHG